MPNDKNEEYVVRRHRAEKALSDIDELEESVAPSFLPSSALNRSRAVREEQQKIQAAEDTEYNVGWMETLSTLKTEKRRKPRRMLEDIFDENKKKKKKKKHKDGEPKDHSEDFERELALLQDLLKDQTILSRSLQARYDILDKQKSSARGVGKFTTDLVTVLNSARKLQEETIDKIIGTKKTIAELNMKEKEKFGKAALAEGSDLSQVTARYLKTILNTDVGNAGNSGYDVEYVDDPDAVADDLFDDIEDIDGYVKRDDTANKYIQFENRNIRVQVKTDRDLSYKEFIAIDQDTGEEVPDYPLPGTLDSVNVNISTMMATDKFGQKYNVIVS